MTLLARIQRFLLILFFLSINFEMWSVAQIGGDLSISRLIGYLYFISITPRLLHFLRIDNLKSFLRPLLMFFGMLTFVNIININLANSNFFFNSLIQNIIIFWIIVNHTRNDQRLLEKGMLSYAIGSIVLATLFNFGIGVGIEDGRASIFGENANVVAIKISISIIIVLYTIFQNRLNLGRIRYALVLSLPLMLKLLAESGSRVAVIATILSVLVGIILLRTEKSWHKPVVVIVGLAFFILMWQYLWQFDVIRNRMLLTVEEGNLSGRSHIWRSSFQIFLHSPIFGVGQTGFYKYSTGMYGTMRSAHNVFLEILCYTGIIGLILFLSFFIRIAYIGYLVFKYRGYLMPILLLIPIFGLMMGHQILGVKTSWIVFAYICSNFVNLQSQGDMFRHLDLPRVFF